MAAWRPVGCSIAKNSIYQMLNFTINEPNSRSFVLGKDTGKEDVLIEEKNGSCKRITFPASSLKIDSAGLKLKLDKASLLIGKGGRIEWLENGKTLEGRAQTIDLGIADISQEVAVYGACSSFLVQSNSGCSQFIDLVSAQHCPRWPSIEEWHPQLSQAEKDLPGGTALLYDFRHSPRRSLSLETEKMLESACEDIRVVPLKPDQIPLQIRPLSLAHRLPLIGDTVWVRGYIRTDRPVVLKCRYAGISRGAETGKNECPGGKTVREGAIHNMDCEYPLFGVESGVDPCASILEGMSGGPATVMENGDERAFAVISSASFRCPQEQAGGKTCTISIGARTMSQLNQNCQNGLSPSFGSNLPRAAGIEFGEWTTKPDQARGEPITFRYSKDGCGRIISKQPQDDKIVPKGFR
ncbi:MAG: hypothetical protein C5B49_05360 [Bdellovibrio sp.]|nr:MAG: hypothetical protein C5B49_05360 [Bdellovibrio sp.]